MDRFRSYITGNDKPQIVGGGHEHYSEEYCRMMNVIDPAPCEFGCEWVAPYGFVRNASCPKHD